MTGDLKLGLLKDEKSQYSQDFQLALQSSFLLPTIDKPTCVHKMSASLIDNISFNNPNQILISGNIITDVCDQFSQFCILTSGGDKITKKETKQNKINKTTKKRELSDFSSVRFNNDLSIVDWDSIIVSKANSFQEHFLILCN